jgi:hypothetical protein
VLLSPCSKPATFSPQKSAGRISPRKFNNAVPLCLQAFENVAPILVHEINSWHVRCLKTVMAIFVESKTSQTFDDSHFFQRLTLIDICCGPPVQA